MPHTTYGVLKAIRSHQITSPRVDSQLRTGRPNACNLCHLDKSLQWASEQLAAQYGQPRIGIPFASQQKPDVAESVRLALEGDSGQRVLIAWHLGWSSAWEASGKEWVAPILGTLLEDPYAAVRCVAERSLKQLNFPLPVGYDFTVTPEPGHAVRNAVWNSWSQARRGMASPIPTGTLIQAGDLDSMARSHEELLGRRDSRKIRLRE